MRDLDKMTFAQFLAEATRLKEKANNAETALLEFLYEVEKHPKIWQGCARGGFVDLLESNDICRPGRYARYKSVMEGAGATIAATVSASGVVAAGALSGPAQQQEAINEMAEWEKVNNKPIPDRSALRIVRGLKARHTSSRQRFRSWDSLYAENQRLHEENQKLKEEVLALRAELGTLKAGAKTTAKTARVQA